MECGALCALPKGKCIVATMRKHSFDLTPMNPIERCTAVSVAAHTFYEKSRPDILPGPGGALHLNNAKYEQQPDGRTVRVSGAEFIPTPRYQVKLEGVQRIGYRSIFVGGVRDPILIGCIDEFLEAARTRTSIAHPDLVNDPENHKIFFHIYGKNAVMGPLEPSASVSHEIGILGEITAPSQDKATAICGFLRVCVLHSAYPKQLATAGNFALPLTPLDSPIGPVFRFSIYHLMDVHGEEVRMFPVKRSTIGGAVNANGKAANGTAKGHVNGVDKVVYEPLAPAILGPLGKSARSKPCRHSLTAC